MPSLSASLTGIIPAYAGSTKKESKERRGSWDHPRVCGEHLICSMPLLTASGSSPRMRGAPILRPPTSTRARIIPAYAGSTGMRYRAEHGFEDHPRVCGEHYPSSRSIENSRGSSPRMRGALVMVPRPPLQLGIIPAYAGSTGRPGFAHAARGDHPRVCGEHFRTFSGAFLSGGSSPRMRGAHGHRDGGNRVGRIIPAYAGSTP